MALVNPSAYIHAQGENTLEILKHMSIDATITMSLTSTFLQLYRLLMKIRIFTIICSARPKPMELAIFALLKLRNRQKDPAVLYTIFLCRGKELLFIRAWTYFMSTTEIWGELLPE